MNWDATTDLLIVGTGAAGMTAAITGHNQGLKICLIEKEKTFGGTSAMSGGSIWVPNNHLMQNKDSFENAFTYLKECIGPSIDEKRVRMYLTEAPKIIEFLMQHTELEVKPVLDFCDYYAKRPGGMMGGRTLEALPFMAKKLGDQARLLHPAHPQELLFGSIGLSSEEGLQLLKGGWPALVLFLKTIFSRLKYIGQSLPVPFRLCLGNALVARLFATVHRLQIPIWYQTKLVDLIMENNQVIGALLEKDQKPFRVRAEKGVILATGGFGKNQTLRERYLPHPTRAEWSSAQMGDLGDTIEIAGRIGAATQLMDEAWWMPVTLLPDQPFPWIIVFEKALPGSIMVNQAGLRFTNEAAPYTDVVKAMYQNHTKGAPVLPIFLIMDATCRKKYPLGQLLPGMIQPDWLIKKAYREKWLTKANSLEALAVRLNINIENFTKTIQQFNQSAILGKDPLFHRGENPYDNCYITAPHSKVCLAPLTKAPFYAIPIYPGDIGTKGGLKTDEYARVLNEKNEVIPNLYAAGNCSASVMGPSYPGAGATLGPAMVFAAIAAKTAAGLAK